MNLFLPMKRAILVLLCKKNNDRKGRTVVALIFRRQSRIDPLAKFKNFERTPHNGEASLLLYGPKKHSSLIYISFSHSGKFHLDKRPHPWPEPTHKSFKEWLLMALQLPTIPKRWCVHFLKTNEETIKNKWGYGEWKGE